MQPANQNQNQAQDAVVAQPTAKKTMNPADVWDSCAAVLSRTSAAAVSRSSAEHYHLAASLFQSREEERLILFGVAMMRRLKPPSPPTPRPPRPPRPSPPGSPSVSAEEPDRAARCSAAASAAVRSRISAAAGLRSFAEESDQGVGRSDEREAGSCALEEKMDTPHVFVQLKRRSPCC
ncbi:hypothetical protein EHS25_002459 [Saitozyma podzolica]|uniref:Uncharacterized protein n=1 Tax=Saitozyma podzolica TaxID=1890683 RepID=A0A427YEG2_9TREE|nr:hypothetical protein EHS25_002459 [Saitozyma podzolica]